MFTCPLELVLCLIGLLGKLFSFRIRVRERGSITTLGCDKGARLRHWGVTRGSITILRCDKGARLQYWGVARGIDYNIGVCQGGSITMKQCEQPGSPGPHCHRQVVRDTVHWLRCMHGINVYVCGSI